MTKINHSTREIFRILHAYARNEIKHRERRNATCAFSAANRAIDAYFHNFGHDAGVQRVVKISRAVLFAVHWKYFKPAEDMPLWASEARIGLNFGPDHSESGYEKPNLPA